MIVCDKCKHVLVKGTGHMFLGSGVTLECGKCGNKTTLSKAIGIGSSQEKPNHEGVRFTA